MRNLTQSKLDLIRKIVNAKFTKSELQAIIKKAQEILNNRKQS